MEIGVYSFGNVRRRDDGSLGSTAEAISDLLQVISFADDVGLDYFGVANTTPRRCRCRHRAPCSPQPAR